MWPLASLASRTSRPRPAPVSETGVGHKANSLAQAVEKEEGSGSCTEFSKCSLFGSLKTHVACVGN